MLPLITKYLPASKDIPQPGVNSARLFLQQFSSPKTSPKKKALFIHGPTGTGKTSAVIALANELDAELVEVNASDTRNADQINAKVGNALKQQSLFFKQKLILIDELDGIAGKQDRGGISALADLIKKAQYPVILIANDPFDSKFSSIRKLAILVEFPALAVSDITHILTHIMNEEKITFDDDALKKLARRCAGDLRGAIIDVQMLSTSKHITKEAVDALSERDKTETMLQALTKILKQSDPGIARGARDHVDEEIDDSFSWIAENMPKEYTKAEDRLRALEQLSKADVFRGRIRRWQYWRFLVYVNDLMTAGVAVAKDAPYRQFVKFEQPKRGLQYWIAKQRHAMRRGIAEKIAEQCHCSVKRALQDILPFLPKLSSHYDLAELKLDEEETTWLRERVQ